MVSYRARVYRSGNLRREYNRSAPIRKTRGAATGLIQFQGDGSTRPVSRGTCSFLGKRGSPGNRLPGRQRLPGIGLMNRVKLVSGVRDRRLPSIGCLCGIRPRASSVHWNRQKGGSPRCRTLSVERLHGARESNRGNRGWRGPRLRNHRGNVENTRACRVPTRKHHRQLGSRPPFQGVFLAKSGRPLGREVTAVSRFGRACRRP